MQEKEKPTCFVSYCREDTDHETIKALVEELREISLRTIEFYYDRDLKGGSRVSMHEERLARADCIVVVLTPQYRAKAAAPENSGVRREYLRILQRLATEKSESARDDAELSCSVETLHVAPILYSGSESTSSPPELLDFNILDFSSFRLQRNSRGKLYVPALVRTRHKPMFEDIISETLATFSSSSDSYAKRFDELLTALFLESKHEQVANDITYKAYAKRLFVKTHAYKLALRQRSYMFIGRKGSGKTTLTRYLGDMKGKKYKPAIEINVDSFNLEYLFQMTITRRVLEDARIVMGLASLFAATWQLFLILSCIETLIREESLGTLRAEARPQVRKFRKLLAGIAGDDEDPELNKVGLFRWCFRKVLEYVDGTIRFARETGAEFDYDLASALSGDKMLNNVLTRDMTQTFRAVVRGCSRRFLVSLDGFDTALDVFRKFTLRLRRVSSSSEREAQLRTEFEVEWLRGFIHAALAIKAPDSQSPMGHMTDFCITIPKDRFLEIERDERDSVVYFGKYHSIRWTGIELAILLRKRLEVLANLPKRDATDKSLKARVRLERVLQEHYGYIPREVVTTVGGREHSVPFFIYVLRHTFWRPREIILYAARVLAVLTELRDKNLPTLESTVRKCVSDSTVQVIEAEFINEFKRHCDNLSEIIQRFRGHRQLLSAPEVVRSLEAIDFVFVDEAEPVRDIHRKLRFLYEIGFLGLDCAEGPLKRLNLLHRDAFYFNAGDRPINSALLDGLSDHHFVIHPVFCEYLSLDTSLQRLTLDFSWQYLEELEVHMFASD